MCNPTGPKRATVAMFTVSLKRYFYYLFKELFLCNEGQNVLLLPPNDDNQPLCTLSPPPPWTDITKRISHNWDIWMRRMIYISLFVCVSLFLLLKCALAIPVKWWLLQPLWYFLFIPSLKSQLYYLLRCLALPCVNITLGFCSKPQYDWWPSRPLKGTIVWIIHMWIVSIY